ncbi:MAG TPA: cytochrome c biogenesis protein ResB [Opitutaceae bacterium]|nr:cytochrome c biogenesis protein ResB [Opitutaceae bacterium]
MPPFVRQLRDLLVSLRLTVALLALSIVLVFWATLDQVHLGVWAVQQKFFHSFLVFARLGELRVPVYPGGYLIGGLLLVNLVCAHAYRFRRGWGKAGIWIAHAGLILLLVGELVSGLVQQDFQMRLDEGETRNFSESSLLNELAVIDTTDPKSDEVVAIPESMVADGTVVQNPRLPFKVVPRGYYQNSTVQLRSQVPGAPPSPATRDMGPQLVAMPAEVTYKQDERNTPAAYIELVGPEGSLGVWTVSTLLGNPQRFDCAGRSWKIVMRPLRHYEPYSLTLEKFSHDIYPGTDIPKNFSSKVRINPPGGGEGREVLIYMNNPLRYGGLTYYQAGFEPNDRTTILQVVRNPSWLAPYIACAAITLGLVIQFVMHLAAFGRGRRRA